MPPLKWVSSLNDNDLVKCYTLTPKKGTSDASFRARYPVCRQNLHHVCRLSLFLLNCVLRRTLGIPNKEPRCRMHVLFFVFLGGGHKSDSMLNDGLIIKLRGKKWCLSNRWRVQTYSFTKTIFSPLGAIRRIVTIQNNGRKTCYFYFTLREHLHNYVCSHSHKSIQLQQLLKQRHCLVLLIKKNAKINFCKVNTAFKPLYIPMTSTMRRKSIRHVWHAKIISKRIASVLQSIWLCCIYVDFI